MIDLNIIDRTTTPPFEEMIQSVNLHITKRCNYGCRFCYARFNQVENRLNEDQWNQVLTLLAHEGTKKVTFVGGEPTLVSFLPQLVIHAKELGLTTMLVTNGTRITPEYLQQFKGTLDWVGLSIDSAKEEICKKIGRGTGNHVAQTRLVSKFLKAANIRIKLNTVVTSLSWNEDMSWLIKEIRPERWKVFQMLPIKGENDDAHDLLVSTDQFNTFVKKHLSLNPVVENNDSMVESYVMVDPEGKFFTNANNQLTHGLPILTYGVRKSFENISFRYSKFIKRGGKYNWEVRK